MVDRRPAPAGGWVLRDKVNIMSITLQIEGRRTYIIGNTYPIRDRIKALGAHWDGDRRAWWTSKRAEAEQLVAQLNEQPPEQPAAQNDSGSKAPRDGENSVVAGRATYKGKTYYVAGRAERGRTHYDDGVRALQTQDGAKFLLYFRDGSSQFWASRAEVQIVKSYDRPQTIAGLRRFMEQQKTAEANGEETCWACRKHCTCGTSFCHHHHDGCDV